MDIIFWAYLLLVFKCVCLYIYVQANQRGTDDLFAFVNRTINRTQGDPCVNQSNLVDPSSIVHNRSTTNTNIVIDPNLLQANCLSKIADTEHRMVELRSALGIYRNDRVTMARLQVSLYANR